MRAAAPAPLIPRPVARVRHWTQLRDVTLLHTARPVSTAGDQSSRRRDQRRRQSRDFIRTPSPLVVVDRHDLRPRDMIF